MLKIKEELGDAEMDIGPSTLQHVDSHHRTDQQYPIVFKKESAIDKSNKDATLSSGVKQEFIWIELTPVDEQKTPQATWTPAAVGSVTVHQDECIKDNLEDTDQDSGPTAFLHMDSSHRTNQNMSVVGREDTIARDRNDPVACDRVKINSSEDKRTAATSSQLCRDVTVPGQHLRSELYSCDKCVQTFTSKDTFRQHHTLSHSTEAHEHNECNMDFKLEFYFHKRAGFGRKLRYECAVCKKIFKSKDGVRGHVTSYHRPRPTGADPDVYICDYCQKMFNSKFRIIDHITSAHASASAASKCNKCGKIYRCRKYLQNHMTNIHTSLMIKCNVCGKLMRLRYLKDHMRNVHSDQKFQCKICKEIMTSQQRLHDHRNNIHGQQSAASPFRCNQCQKVYACKRGLNVHIRNLHGKDCFGCPQCECSFKSKAYLHSHMKRKHKGSNQPSTCSKLGEGSGESTHPPVGKANAAASASTQQQDVIVKIEDPADEEMELGPVVFQHMDHNYRPYKEEPLLD